MLLSNWRIIGTPEIITLAEVHSGKGLVFGYALLNLRGQEVDVYFGVVSKAGDLDDPLETLIQETAQSTGRESLIVGKVIRVGTSAFTFSKSGRFTPVECVIFDDMVYVGYVLQQR